RAADAAAEPGQPVGAEDDDHDGQNDEQLWQSDTPHARAPWLPGIVPLLGGQRPPGEPDFECPYESPFQRGVRLPPGDEVRHPATCSAPKSCALSDGTGHEYGSSRAPVAMRVAPIHCAVCARSAADVLPASACAQTPIARWSGRGNDQRYPGGSPASSMTISS